MARAKTSPTARLEALRRVKPRLRRFKKDETLSARPMAEFIGVTWPVLRQWCDEFPALEETGAFVRGGNGVEWVFRPREMVAGLTAEFDALVRTGREKAARVRRMVAGANADAIPEDASLDDMRKQLEVSARLRIEREAHGKLVDAEETVGVLQRVFGSMRDAGLRTVQVMDPNGRWTPEQRQMAQDIATGILVAQETAAQNCLKEIHGGAA